MTSKQTTPHKNDALDRRQHAGLTDREIGSLDLVSSLAPGSVGTIVNIGNLVCPYLFGLGETVPGALLSETEGDDKPAKYPRMFQSSELIALNENVLLP